jgi:hypothetical protein
MLGDFLTNASGHPARDDPNSRGLFFLAPFFIQKINKQDDIKGFFVKGKEFYGKKLALKKLLFEVKL